jgi:hypothetical protein
MFLKHAAVRPLTVIVIHLILNNWQFHARMQPSLTKQHILYIYTKEDTEIRESYNDLFPVECGCEGM